MRLRFALPAQAAKRSWMINRFGTGWRLPVKAGQRLTLHRPLHVMRSYLAVAGGIAAGGDGIVQYRSGSPVSVYWKDAAKRWRTRDG